MNKILQHNSKQNATRLRYSLSVLMALCLIKAHPLLAVGYGTLDQTSGWYPLGTNLTVHAVPRYDSVFNGWLGNTNGALMISTQITFAVNGNLSVTGLFSIAQYTLGVTSPLGIPSPAGLTTNAYGTLINAYIPSPVLNGATQYVTTGWTGTGSLGSGTGTNASINLTNNSTLTWLWQTNYQITASAGPNGSITPSGPLYVGKGANQSYKISPNANYSTTSVTVDGTNVGTTASYTFSNVMAAHSIQAVFAINQFTLTVASSQGSPALGGTSTHAYDTLINAYVASPIVNGATQYVAKGWAGTGSAGSGTGTNATFNITNNTSLTWLWQTNVWVNLNGIGN